MQKFSQLDNGNPDGTAKDRNGVVSGTLYKAKYYNDNIFNLFEFLTTQGYTLIAGDKSQLAKANKSLYNPLYTYNTSAISTQSVSDIVQGSDGYYYEALTNGINGDNPVGSATNSWKKVPYDKLTEINNLTAKATPVDADVFVIADSADTFSLKKFTWANLKATLANGFVSLVGFAISLGENGYIKLPNALGGLIIQQITVTQSMAHTGTYVYTFPLTFPNAMLGAVSDYGDGVTTGSTAIYLREVGFSNSTVSYQFGSLDGITYTTKVRIIAIGH